MIDGVAWVFGPVDGISEVNPLRSGVMVRNVDGCWGAGRVLAG